MKTPEQMAKEYGDYFAPGEDNKAYTSVIKEIAFLAGYKAAMNSPEKLDSCEHILDMEKMVDVNSSSGWISVKERLPEDKESVIYWHDLHGTNIGHYDSTFPKPNYHWWSYNYGDHADFRVHWWMPLPKIPEAPKEEYQFTGRDVPIFEKPKGE
jgi:hypothetical protein